MNKQEQPAGADPVHQRVRPRAWLIAGGGWPDAYRANEDGAFSYWKYGRRAEGAMEPLFDVAALDAAVAAERERCAKEAEHWQSISTTPGHACGQYIAAAIRGLTPNAKLTGEAGKEL